MRQVVSPRRDPGWIIYISRASYQMLSAFSWSLWIMVLFKSLSFVNKNNNSH